MIMSSANWNEETCRFVESEAVKSAWGGGPRRIRDTSELASNVDQPSLAGVPVRWQGYYRKGLIDGLADRGPRLSDLPVALRRGARQGHRGRREVGGGAR